MPRNPAANQVAVIPAIGPALFVAAGTVLAAVVPKIGEALNDLLDLKDDKIGEATLVLTAKQMVMLAARTANSNFRSGGFKVETPLLTGGGAAYKVYFGVTPA